MRPKNRAHSNLQQDQFIDIPKGITWKLLHFPTFIRLFRHNYRNDFEFKMDMDLMAVTVLISFVTGALIGGRIVDYLWRGR